MWHLPLLTPEQQQRLDEAAAQALLSRPHDDLPLAAPPQPQRSAPPAAKPSKAKHKNSGPGHGTALHWGSVFDGVAPPITSLDKSDPNWEDDGRVAAAGSRPGPRAPALAGLEAYKRACDRILASFFSTLLCDDALAGLEALDQPLRAQHFVKRGECTRVGAPRHRRVAAVTLTPHAGPPPSPPPHLRQPCWARWTTARRRRRRWRRRGRARRGGWREASSRRESLPPPPSFLPLHPPSISTPRARM